MLWILITWEAALLLLPDPILPGPIRNRLQPPVPPGIT